MAAEYRWVITRDLISRDDDDDTGVTGPSDADADVTDNAAKFSMWDDDDNCYYEGMLYGDYAGFEPLDDFGTPNAGCSAIKLDGEWL